MNRTQKLKLNTIISILNRIIIMISGLILPRLILANYGSETNGLTSSISQFLGIITFLDLGVGSVVKSALYRPIAEKDHKQINSVLIAGRNYFKKIAYILVLYVVVLIVFYPLLIDSNLGYLSGALLIFAMSISFFGRYYFGIVNELLLSANQQDYIQLGSEIVVVVLNLLISIVLINQGATIEMVKLGSGLVYLIRPVFLSYYVKRNFTFDYDVEYKEDPLPHRWSGMGQHIAYSIQNGTDAVVLTVFSTLQNVSVYAVYNMVVLAMRTLIASLTTGIESLFGDLYAKNEAILLAAYFDKVEWIIHTLSIYLYGMTAVLINSFVEIYTTGVEDISYEAPLFSFLLVLAGTVYAVRTPYQSMIFSAGHFRQTQKSSYIEAGLNIFLSVILVYQFGLIGVAIGTFVSMIYRTIYLVLYLSKNIVFRSLKLFAKHVLVDVISMGAIYGIGIILTNMVEIDTFVDWVITAAVLGMISVAILLVINLIFYKDIMSSTVRNILKRG